MDCNRVCGNDISSSVKPSYDSTFSSSAIRPQTWSLLQPTILGIPTWLRGRNGQSQNYQY
eukprot:901621-Amphidinium_carterae.1